MAVAERFKGANTIDAGRLSPYWGEHAARYVLARSHVAGKRVLDIACGTGYGIALLRDAAREIVGVDIDLAAAKEAADECGGESTVLIADGLKLPFGDQCFDAITSFETLEHLKERSAFVAELGRVLRPGGKLLLSTPNALYTMPHNGIPSNPFHIHEYVPAELSAELSANFYVEELLGQDIGNRARIPPFYEAQRRLPGDLKTQLRLFGWKMLNKMPPGTRDRVSHAVWGEPFFPTEHDYRFDAAIVETAPTLLAVCRK